MKKHSEFGVFGRKETADRIIYMLSVEFWLHVIPSERKMTGDNHLLLIDSNTSHV